MARALQQIMQELDAVYSPQKDVYNQQLKVLPSQQQSELQGLNVAKDNSFDQITRMANRNGVAFGGIPLEEQARYLGSTFLPSVANLKGRFQGQASDLSLRLAELAAKQGSEANSIWQTELARDEERRQFDERLKAQMAAASAGSGGGGGSSGGGSSGGSGYFGGFEDTGGGENTPQVLGTQQTLRQMWQQEANAGDWEAQTLLNFVGDDNNFDGAVNNQSEYDILKKYGVTGNYYVRPSSSGGGGGGW